jgi:acetyltransferase-like isoleucine patch superfamily enzyme
VTMLDHDWFPRPLPDTVTLGKRSWLYSSYAVHHNRGRVAIGSDCGVYNGTHFELGPDGEVEIGDFTTIVGAVIATNGRVTIGDRCFIAHEVFIASSQWARPPDNLSSGPVDPPIEICSGAWIGTRAVVLAPARVGRDAIVGAGAVLTGEVPDGAAVVGNPGLLRVRGRPWPS